MTPQIAYVFNDKKIIEKKISEYKEISEETKFVRVEDIGIVIFDKGAQKVKHGEVLVALHKDVFGDEELLRLRLRLQKLNNYKNTELQALKRYEADLYNLENRINSCKNSISYYEEEIINIKQLIKKESCSNE